MPTTRIRTGASALSLLALLAFYPIPAAAQMGPGGPSPVSVLTLEQGDFPIISVLPGRVNASTVAEVRPQVNGIIRERLFEEGSVVTEGQPLYKIEDDSYAAQVAAAKAAVAQARATYLSGLKDAKRAQELFGNSVGSEQRLDLAIATRDAAAAALQLANAQMTSAEIDLHRTMITAPIAGTIGFSETTTGALVSAGQATALATIRGLDTVFVDVTQSATDLLKWRNRQASGDASPAGGEVRLVLADKTVYPLTGKLTAAEPQVNPTTGMVTLRMSFPNPDGLLLPGMYVQVELPLAVAKDAVAVPQQAVMRDRNGVPNVWVVGAGDVVENRVIEVVQAHDGKWIASEGLKSGDRVIVSGFQKTAVGAQVVPEELAGAEAAVN